jgi:hypothetical protein
MAEPKRPRRGDVGQPDPEEPVFLWQVVGCGNCGRTLWRVARKVDPPAWRHLWSSQRECRPDGIEDLTDGRL